MKKKSKALLFIAFSALLAAGANSAESAAASPATDGPMPSDDKMPENQMDASKQFIQLVQQQKYDESLVVLHDVYKLDSLGMLKQMMLLENREQARVVMGKFFDKYSPLSGERDSLHGYAVDLSHKEIFAESLMILQWLYQNDTTDKPVLYDYIVVLNWSGNNRGAVDMFEKEKVTDPPAFVLRSVGGSYYQLQNYEKSVDYLGQAAAKGDRKAKIWQAQSYYRLGDTASANAIYDALLAQTPNDIEVLRSRASMKMMAGNYTEALVDFQKVLEVSAGMDNAAEIKKAVDYDMAIAHIRLGEESKAILLLKPYVDNGTADTFMQADYILALRLYQDYPTAVAEGTRLWPDWGKVPVFGLQAYADSYVRLGQVKKAIPIYEHIRKRDPNANGAKLGLAFSQMMTGHIDEGLKVYDELFTIDPSLADVALDDAYYFFEQGKYVAGTKLYNLVVTRFPNNPVYRQEFASSLADNEMPRDAYHQYKALSNVGDGEAAGLSGMVENAVEVGDYHQASQAVSKLQEQYAGNVLAEQAMKAYEERRKGGADMGFNFYHDYKGVEYQNWQLNGDQSLGNSSFSILAQVNHNKLDNKDTGTSTTINSQALGVGLKNIRSDFQAWYYNYQNNGRFSGYKFISNFYPSDRVTFGLDASRGPLAYSPESMNPSLAGFTDGRIMTNDYTLRTSIKDGTKNVYEFSYTHRLYSDDNRANSYNASWIRTLLFNDQRESYRFLFWNHDTWNIQRPELYDSPSSRNTYGVGWNEKWKFAKHYWELTGTLEWGRDNPENTEFQPNLRLEYGYNFSPTRILVLAAEYGARTDNTNNSGSLSHFGYSRYEVNYEFSW